MYVPALLLAVPFLGGAAAALLFCNLFNGLSQAPEMLFAGAASLGLIGAIGAYASDDRVTAFGLIVVTTSLAGVSLGSSDARRIHRTSLAAWFAARSSDAVVTVRGVLVEDASRTPSGATLLVDVSSIGGDDDAERAAVVRGGVRLAIAGTLFEDRLQQWRAGRTVRVPAFLRQPSTYLNPGTPDERPALARRGIVLVGSVKSPALVEVAAPGTIVSEAAAALRAAIRRRLRERLAARDPAAAGVATAVLIGDRSGLGSDDERRLQEAGTYHVIAISGGNIAILAVLATIVLRLLFVRQRAASILTAAVILFYGSVATGAASVARAVTVAVLVLLARALDHRVRPINVLAMAALLAAAVSPAVVLDAGFHLSFGATLGILLGLPRLDMVLRREPRRESGWRIVPATLVRMFAATACAEIALAPVSATLFCRISFAGLFLNFLAIPLMTVVQVGGLVVALAPASIAPIWGAASAAVQSSAEALLRSAAIVEAAPWLVHDVGPPAWWLTTVYYTSALLMLQPCAVRPAIPAFVLSTALLLAGPRFAMRDAVPPTAAMVRVVVLDVGQGDATVVALPGGLNLLVDAGGVAPLATGPDAFDALPGFDVGERVVSRALRALDVRHLEGLVLTHGDPDHILGARGVLKHTPAHTVWEGVPVPPHPGLQALIAYARTRGISWRTVQAGDVERFGAVEVRVLHPPPPDWERQRVRNEDSVVLEIRVGEVSIVLPGDIGREGERTILPRLDRDRLVILKAPHHGSATSSTAELLERLRPAAVIFSSGRNNRFGHPHPAVVERYKAIGAAIFSTAEDGAVFVETDGRSVEVRGWMGKKSVLQRLTQ